MSAACCSTANLKSACFDRAHLKLLYLRAMRRKKFWNTNFDPMEQCESMHTIVVNAKYYLKAKPGLTQIQYQTTDRPISQLTNRNALIENCDSDAVN